MSSVGFERVRLIELPVIHGPMAAEWGECKRHLQRATNELGLGKSDAAIGACRQVLEGLVTVIAKRCCVDRADRESMGSWLKKLLPALRQAWLEDTESAELLVAVYRAVWLQIPPSAHRTSGQPGGIGKRRLVADDLAGTCAASETYFRRRHRARGSA